MTVILVLLLYLLASLGFIAYLFARKASLLLPIRVLFTLCVLAHLLFVISLWRSRGMLPMTSPEEAMNMLILFSSTALLPFTYRKNTTVLGAFFLPAAACALAFVAMPLQSESSMILGSYRFWYPLHTLSVIIGEAFFVVATIVSVVYLVHERIIRKGFIHSSVSALPPLTLLDRILYASLSMGFFAITAGMISGGLWATAAGLTFSSIAPKVLAGALTWLVFGLSLHQRFAIGWKGRRTAVITLIGFFVMVLLFIGINMFFPDAHGIGLV